jgi:hypothetical protein
MSWAEKSRAEAQTQTNSVELWLYWLLWQRQCPQCLEMESLGLKPRLRPTASSYGFIGFYGSGNVRNVLG